jgi:hypothetical protein
LSWRPRGKFGLQFGKIGPAFEDDDDLAVDDGLTSLQRTSALRDDGCIFGMAGLSVIGGSALRRCFITVMRSR